MAFFTVAQPDYDGENIDSVWSTEQGALARAAELGHAVLTEYESDTAKGWVRNGWYAADGPKCWSDWGWDQPMPWERP